MLDDGLWQALLYSLLPAGATLGAGLTALKLEVPRRVLALALHFAAGVVLAVIGVELLPEAFETNMPWAIVLAFIAGGLAYESIEFVLQRLRRPARGKGVAGWLVLAGVSVDLLTDGLMIGAGTTVSAGLGLLLALGQAPADIPGAFVTVAGLKEKNLSRPLRLAVVASLAGLILLGTVIGYMLVRGQPDLLRLGLLAFTGGILVTVVVEALVPQAHETPDSRWSTLIFLAGFALFALLAAYME